jgi:hypothetical protein
LSCTVADGGNAEGPLFAAPWFVNPHPFDIHS